MAFQTWVTLVNTGQQVTPGVGKEFTNSVTATDISPGAAVSGEALTIPAGFLVPGNIIRTTAAGWYENEAAKKPTIVWSLTFGGITSGKALAESAAMETVEAGKEVPWRWEFVTRVKESGEKAKVQTTGIGYGLGKTAEAVSTAAVTFLVPEKSKTGKETEINTAVANFLTLAVKYSEAGGAAQHIQCLHWLVEILN